MYNSQEAIHMKAIIVLVGLIGLGIVGMYYFGGYSSFDPDQQGRDAKAAITPGMTWTQVIAAAGENPKLHTISIHTREIAGQKIQERQVGPAVQFSKAKVASAVNSGRYGNGFILSYHFSQQVAFDVTFNAAGIVIDIEDAATIADLLQTREH
jgi:hypothetical protein